MKKIFLILAFLIGLLGASFGQSAVYFCTTTGAVGYSYNNSYYYTNAYNNCIYYGGISPVLVTSTSGDGYGVIVIGYNVLGKSVIGVALGCESSSRARSLAINSCRNAGATSSISILDSWYDPY